MTRYFQVVTCRGVAGSPGACKPRQDAPALLIEAEPSTTEVMDNFRRYDLLDDRVQFLPGWFDNTLPAVSRRNWAVIRIDADMYGSTIEALRILYPRLSRGGYLIVDDYGVIESARRAVDDYRAERGISESIEEIDHAGVLWRPNAHDP